MAMWREVRAFNSSHNTPLLSSLSPSLGKFFFSPFLCLVNWRAENPLLGTEPKNK